MDGLYFVETEYSNFDLYHHGVKGQKWGVRRYQNSDGSLTDAGKRRYGEASKRGSIISENKRQKAYGESQKGIDKANKQLNKINKKVDKLNKKGDTSSDKYNKAKNDQKEAQKVLNDQKKAQKQILKDLKMPTKEINYRKALNDYNNYISGKDLSVPVRVLTAGWGQTVALASSAKGRELGDKLALTSRTYKDSLK